MKYTKTATAMALAGIAASPLAQAQDTTITLSGQVAIGIIASDADDEQAIDIGDNLGLDPDTGIPIIATADDVRDAASPGDATIFGDDSTININAVGKLNNGLEGFANYRTDLGLVGDSAVGDDIHVGVRGDFGEVRVGEVTDATGFGQLAGDFFGNSDIDGEDFGIGYTGSFAGADFGINWSPAGSSDRFGIGVKYSIAGFGVGFGFGNEDGDGEGRDEYSLGASYAIAGVSLAASYKDRDFGEEFFTATASYGFGNWSAGIGFEALLDGADEDDTYVRLDLGYDLGTGMNISTRVNIISDDDDDDNDLTDFRVLLVKAF